MKGAGHPLKLVRAALLATLLATGLTLPGVARAEPAASARLDSIATVFAQRGFAGAICVMRGADTLLDRGYGMADREAGIANAAAVRYPIGSLTKSFTAAAVMKLVERGKLTTSDSLRRWVPEVSPAWSGVTLRHLLTHTAGIPDPQDDSDFVRFGREGSPGLIAARRYAGRPLDFPPGSGYAYSNTGYQVLGAVIEAASGESYESFVEHELLQPLHLAETGFEPGVHDSANEAVGYFNKRSGVVLAPVNDLGMAYAAGALVSTTHDLVRWEQALLQGGVVHGEAFTEMVTPLAGDYAYGIHHRAGPGREVYYHTGKIGGFDSAMGWYPADSVAVVVLGNHAGGWRINELYDALAGASHAAERGR